MKVNKFLAMAMIAAMTAASCSDDVTGEITPDNPDVTEQGKAYVSLAINLPTTSVATRGENDKYDDGIESEYEVKNAMLILFTKTSNAAETAASVHSAYDLTPSLAIDDVDNDNITTTYRITQEVKNVATTTDLYALVVINNNSTVTIGTDNTLSGITGTNNSITFADVLKATFDGSFNGENAGFLMTNAPLSTAAGGEASTAPSKSDVQTLVKLDASKIKATKEEAQGDPAASIFVERALAKVSVKSSTTSKTLTNNVSYELQNWILDNTNSTSYLVRNTGFEDAQFTDYMEYNTTVSNKTYYRFAGNIQIGESYEQPAVKYYRTYWAKDVNYTGSESGAPALISNIDGTWKSFSTDSDDSYDYCKENTFNVANQIKSATTRVIVSAKFNNGTTFYVVNGDKTTFLTEDDIKNKVASYLFANADFAQWVKNNLADASSSPEDQADDDEETVTLETLTTSDFVFTFSAYAEYKNNDENTLKLSDRQEVYELKSIAVAENSKSKFKTDTEFNNMPTDTQIKLINEYIVINQYENGIAYYDARIQHFGDDYTPWTASDENKGANAYGSTDTEKNFLGRYGVVRNNWYELDITAIKELGSSTVPSISGTRGNEPDDYTEDKQFMSFKINILSWAKRSQNVIL